jgi:uncharacterized zinc-type alcohol dehydrogenase-like protein
MNKPISYSTKAYSTTSAKSPLGAATIERRQPTASDVQIQIQYCGVCHSDLHFAATNGASRNIRRCPVTRSWGA